MKRLHHVASKATQVIVIGSLSAMFGVAVAYQPISVIFILALLVALIYTQVVLVDYQKVLGAIILVIPFNFESLIAAINTPFVNPFNILWISYIGIVALRSVHRNEPILVRSPLNTSIFFLMLIFALSMVQAKWIVHGYHFKDHIFMTWQQWFQWLLFYFFCLKGIRSEKEARQVITWVMLMILFAGMQNIRDYIGMIGRSSGATLERASGLFSNANYSASFFCYYVPVAVGLALANLKEFRSRLFFSAVAGVGLIAVVVTYSRGGMAAVGLASMLIAAFSKLNPRLILVLLVVVGLGATNENISKRFGQSSVEGTYGKTVDPSIHARVVAWSKAFDLIKERPFIGHGFFTFRYIKVEKWEDEAAKAHGSGGMAVHNGFLNVLVNSGFIGLAIFMWFMGAALKMCWDIFRDSPHGSFWRGAALGLFAGLLALLLVNMTGTRLYDRQMVGYMWILLGALYQGHYFSKGGKAT